jgi:hypothetical protein
MKQGLKLVKKYTGKYPTQEDLKRVAKNVATILNYDIKEFTRYCESEITHKIKIGKLILD